MSNWQFILSPVNGHFIEDFQAGDDMGRFVFYIYIYHFWVGMWKIDFRGEDKYRAVVCNQILWTQDPFIIKYY